jgi:hypothetical protein
MFVDLVVHKLPGRKSPFAPGRRLSPVDLAQLKPFLIPLALSLCTFALAAQQGVPQRK